MTTKLPSIPNFDGTNIGDVLSALTEATQVRVGVRGDALDAGVTFRDLAGIGLVQTTTGAGRIQGLSARAPVRLPDGETGPLYDGAADLTTPPAPTELKAVAVFDTVFLSWNVAGFANPSYYEIFRAFENDLSIAQRAGTSTSQFFADIIGESRTLYYWVRTVSMAGVRSAWNSSFGTEVKTGVDPKNILPILERQILESALAQELATRINDTNDQTIVTIRGLAKEVQDRIAAINAEAVARVAAISAEANTRAQALLSEAAARGTAITNEATLRTNADNALAQQISTLTASLGATTAALQVEQTARVDGDSAQAAVRETLATQLRGSYTGTDVTQLSSGLVFSERQSRVAADSSLSSRSDALEATVNNATTGLVATRATLINDYYTKSVTDSAIAASSSALTTNFNNTLSGYTNTATLTANHYTKSATDSAITASANTLTTNFNNTLSGYTNTASLQANYYTQSATNQAITNATTNLVSNTSLANTLGSYATNSTLTNNYLTSTQTNQAITNASTTLTASFNSSLSNYPTTASVQQNFFAKADGQGLQGQYTVKIDNNGHVSGFGLASIAVNGTPTSAFIVRADKFAIVDPATQQHGLNTLSPIEDIVPFAYTSGSPGIPEGVYIKQARIKNGDITDAKIGSVSAKKLTAGFVRATIGIDGAKVYGAELYSGGQTTVTYGADGYPSAFTASNPTVAISNGNAEFVVSNFKIRHPTNTQLAPFTPFEVTGNEVHIGTAFIKNGTIGIAKIEDVIKSTNYDISTTGWKLTKTGAFDLKNGTITAGLIQSTDGKMRIDLSNGFIRIEA